MLPRPVPAGAFWRSALSWLRKHPLKIVVSATVGFVVGWGVNTLIMGFRYDGYVAPSGNGVATAEGSFVTGGLFWVLLTMVIVSFVTFGASVGWARAFSDLAALPMTVTSVFRESDGKAWSVALWAASMMLVISSVLAPALSAAIGVGFLLAAPTALTGILGRLVTSLWAGVIGLFAPKKKPSVPGLGGSLVGVVGSGIGMVVAAQSDSVPLKLVGAVILALGAYLIVAGAGSTATSVLVAVAATSAAIWILSRTGIALADDGGWTEFRQANPGAGFWDWFRDPDTRRVLTLAGAGGFASALGSVAGVSIGSVLAALQGLPGLPPGWLPDPGDVLSPEEAAAGAPALFDPETGVPLLVDPASGEPLLEPLPEHVGRVDEAAAAVREVSGADGWISEHQDDGGILLTPRRPVPDAPEGWGLVHREDGTIRLTPPGSGNPYAESPAPPGYLATLDEQGNVVLVPDPEWSPPLPDYDPDQWEVVSNPDGSMSLRPRGSEPFPPPPSDFPAAPDGEASPAGHVGPGSTIDPARMGDGRIPGSMSNWSGRPDEIVPQEGYQPGQPDAPEVRPVGADGADPGTTIDPARVGDVPEGPIPGSLSDWSEPVDPFDPDDGGDAPRGQSVETVRRGSPLDAPGDETAVRVGDADTVPDTVRPGPTEDPFTVRVADNPLATAPDVPPPRVKPGPGFSPSGHVFDHNGVHIGYWDPSSIDADGTTTMVDVFGRPGVPVVNDAERILGVAPRPDADTYVEYGPGGQRAVVTRVPEDGTIVGRDVNGLVLDENLEPIGRRIDDHDPRTGEPRTRYVNRDGDLMTVIEDGRGGHLVVGQSQESTPTPVRARETPDGLLIDDSGNELGRRVGEVGGRPVYEDVDGRRLPVEPIEASDPSRRSVGVGDEVAVTRIGSGDGTQYVETDARVPLPEEHRTTYVGGGEGPTRLGLDPGTRKVWDIVGAGPNGELYGQDMTVIGRIDERGHMTTGDGVPLTAGGVDSPGRPPVFFGPDGQPIGADAPPGTRFGRPDDSSTPRGADTSTAGGELADRATTTPEPGARPDPYGGIERHPEFGTDPPPAAGSGEPGTGPAPATGETPPPATVADVERTGMAPGGEAPPPVGEPPRTGLAPGREAPRVAGDPEVTAIDPARPGADVAPVAAGDVPASTGAMSDTVAGDAGSPGAGARLAGLAGDAADLAGNYYDNLEHGMTPTEALAVGVGQTAAGNAVAQSTSVVAGSAQEATAGSRMMTESAVNNMGGSLAAGTLLPDGLDNLMAERMAANTVRTIYEGVTAAAGSLRGEDGAFSEFVDSVRDRPTFDPFGGLVRMADEIGLAAGGEYDDHASATLDDHLAAAQDRFVEGSTAFQQRVAAGGTSTVLQGYDHAARIVSDAIADPSHSWSQATSAPGEFWDDTSAMGHGEDLRARADGAMLMLGEAVDHLSQSAARGETGMITQGWAEIGNELEEFTRRPVGYLEDTGRILYQTGSDVYEEGRDFLGSLGWGS